MPKRVAGCPKRGWQGAGGMTGGSRRWQGAQRVDGRMLGGVMECPRRGWQGAGGLIRHRGVRFAGLWVHYKHPGDG